MNKFVKGLMATSAIVMASVSFVAHAAEVRWNWAYDNNTPVEVFKLYCGGEAGTYTDLFLLGGGQTRESTIEMDLSRLSYCALTATNTAGSESAYSSEAVVDNSIPAAPQGLNGIYINNTGPINITIH